MGTVSRSCGGPVVVVDDSDEFRELVASILRAAGFTVAELATGAEALEVARSERPAAVVLDVHLPDISGYEVCRRLREDFGLALPILFVSGERTESFDRVAGLLIGADDYLVKPVAPDELVARLRSLLRRAPTPVPERFARLTKREVEVLRLLADGLGQGDIARTLFISPKTVGTHVEHILEKLGVRSRAQAIALAYRDELVERSA